MRPEFRRLDLRGRRGGDLETAEMAEVVDHLRGGGLVVCPTETLYGVGGLLRPDALDALRRLKRRDEERPFLALVPDMESVADLRWTPEARELAEVFWPGSVTLVLEDPAGRFPPGVRSPEGGVAVRRCAHPLAARVVRALGEPMTSTSVNAPGEPPARDAAAVVAVLEQAMEGDEAGRSGPGVWILDVGALPPSSASTIVDCTGDRPRVLRAGATPVSRIRCLLPEIHESE